jgi:hypothetical protein
MLAVVVADGAGQLGQCRRGKGDLTGLQDVGDSGVGPDAQQL